MTKPSAEPQVSDPDNVAETLCIGRFSVAKGPGPLVTITFTNVRNKCGPLMDQGVAVQESVVRARIVTTLGNLVALRDLLNLSIRETSPATAGSQGDFTLN